MSDTPMYTTVSLAEAANVLQKHKEVYSVDINKPLFDNNTEIRLVDAAINRPNDYYENFSKISIDGADKFFGIKRIAWFSDDEITSNASVPEKHDIKGKVVLLMPTTTQRQIYSFKNGMQYVELSRDALKKEKLLPSYIYSYEYIVDGLVPENKDIDTNLRFYGSNGKYESVVTANNFDGFLTISNTTDKLSIYSSYSFSISYILTEEGDTYFPIQKPKGLEKNNGEIYECTYEFLDISLLGDAQALVMNYADVFEEKVSYVKTPDPISIQDLEQSTEKYYWYDKTHETYLQCSGDISNYDLSSLYVRCRTYVKSSDDLLVGGKPAKFLQKYDWELYEDTDKQCNEDILYIKRDINASILDSIYIEAYPSIRPNGPVQYYAYTYIDTKDIEKDYGIDYSTVLSQDYINIYIKQEYREITEEEFEDYVGQDLYTYEGDDIVYKEYLTNSDYIYDLDISGNSVYLNSQNVAIPLSSTPEQQHLTATTTLYEIYNENWKFANVDELRAKNMLDTLTMRQFGIFAKLDYNGKWKKIDVKSAAPTFDEYAATNGRVFVKEQSYNKVQKHYVDVSSNVDYYVWMIGKIDSDSVSVKDDVTQTDITKATFIDVTRYGLAPRNEDIVCLQNGTLIGKINKYGFINGVEYWKRTPQYTMSNDLYKFLSKDYFIKKGSKEIQCSSPVLPLSFIKYGGNPTGHSLGQATYRKIANSLAKTLIENGNTGILYELYDEGYRPINEYYESVDYYVDISNVQYDDNASQENASKVISVSVKPYSSIPSDSIAVKYYKNDVSNYLRSDEFIEMSKLLGLSYDNNFLYSKYFYPESSINNGIHHAKDGSYYSTVSIYDGTRGTISKSLLLQPNIFNITEYRYVECSTVLTEAISEDLSAVNENHYRDYYVSWDNDLSNLCRLSAESESPAYWQSYIYSQDVTTYKLLTEKTKMTSMIFDGSTVEGVNENN